MDEEHQIRTPPITIYQRNSPRHYLPVIRTIFSSNINKNWLVQQFKTFTRGIFHIQQQKPQQIIMLLSIYLFAHFVVKSLLEFLAEYFPKFNYSKLIKCLNNIVDSMLVFSLMLGNYLKSICSLGFVLLPMFITNYQIDQQIGKLSTINAGDQSVDAIKQLQGEKYSQQFIFVILETFFYGRVLFSVGYIFGVFISLESFRGPGVSFSLAAIVLGLSQHFQIDVLKYF